MGAVPSKPSVPSKSLSWQKCPKMHVFQSQKTQTHSTINEKRFRGFLEMSARNLGKTTEDRTGYIEFNVRHIVSHIVSHTVSHVTVSFQSLHVDVLRFWRIRSHSIPCIFHKLLQSYLWISTKLGQQIWNVVELFQHHQKLQRETDSSYS